MPLRQARRGIAIEFRDRNDFRKFLCWGLDIEQPRASKRPGLVRRSIGGYSTTGITLIVRVGGLLPSVGQISLVTMRSQSAQTTISCGHTDEDFSSV